MAADPEYLADLAADLRDGLDLAQTPNGGPSLDYADGVERIAAVHGERLATLRLDGSHPDDALLRHLRDDLAVAVAALRRAVTTLDDGDPPDVWWRNGIDLAEQVAARLRDLAADT